MTYDHWKTTNPADEFLGPAPPPCERNYAGHVHDHPRFPSGDCVECGALCTEGCKHELAIGEFAPTVSAHPRTFRPARTTSGQLFVGFLRPANRIAGDITIMAPIVALRERDPVIQARARQYDDADFDYAMEAEAAGVTVGDLVGRA